jgi:hypothetical protein
MWLHIWSLCSLTQRQMYTTNQGLREYEITLRSGVWYLLAPNSEHAAWRALELSRERNDQLLNVKQTDEW